MEEENKHPVGTQRYFNCVCGVMLSPYSIGNHLKSKNHLKIIEMKKEILDLQKENVSLKQRKNDLEMKLWKIENDKS